MKKNVMGLFILLLTLCTLNSCEPEDEWESIEQKSEVLCSVPWIEYYVDQNGVECSQQLIFYASGRGLDVTTCYYGGHVQTDSYAFDWYWESGRGKTLVMDYGWGDISYFTNVWVNYDLLTGDIDDVPVAFHPL